jgi:hypothetical protein
MSLPRTFVIRRTFVVPMGLVVVLLLALLLTCIVQGQSTFKIVLLPLFILPSAALFIESLRRRIVVDEAGVTAFRAFRQRRTEFAGVTSLESVRVRNRVFLTLSSGPDDFMIISNSYQQFPELLEVLIELVPPTAVTEEARELAQRPPRRHADTFTVWFAVLALAYVLVAQFR